MKWFKFYGQDFLTDSKLGALNPLQKLMWVGLLCIASQDDKRTGIIKFLTEDRLMDLCGIRLQDFEAFGCNTYVTLETFCNMGLVTRIDKDTIIVTKFQEKQTQSGTSTERVAAWRNKKKLEYKPLNNVTSNMLHETNVTLHETLHVTADKNGIDKNKESEVDKSTSPLTAVREVKMGGEFGDIEIKDSQKKPKDKTVVRIQFKFRDLCKKNLNQEPALTIKDYKIAQFALKHLTEEKIYDLFDEWFGLGKPDEETIQMTRALSGNQINGYKVRNNK